MGIYFYSSTQTIKKCIFWGNLPQQINNYSASPTFSYCDVEGGWGGTGNISTYPSFWIPHRMTFICERTPPASTKARIQAFLLRTWTGLRGPLTGMVMACIDEFDFSAYEFDGIAVSAGEIRLLPQNSIQRAINVAYEGSSIILYPGVYMEHIDLSSKAVTIVSVNPWSPNCVSATIVDSGGSGSGADKNYATLERLFINTLVSW